MDSPWKKEALDFHNFMQTKICVSKLCWKVWLSVLALLAFKLFATCLTSFLGTVNSVVGNTLRGENVTSFTNWGFESSRAPQWSLGKKRSQYQSDNSILQKSAYLR